MTSRPVGFIGLGQIGKPMAQRLLAWPGGLWVYDVAEEPVAELASAGAHVAASVAELASHVGLVCVMVRDDAQVRDVVDEVISSRAGSLVVAIHSTVSPGIPAELAVRAAPHGIRVIDAPVSGGAMGAAAGTLAVLVGGCDEAFAVCAEPFALVGSMVVHAGPVGTGTAMKLARNLIHFASFTAVTEAQQLAEAAGLDLVELGEVVRHTDAVTGGPGAIMHRATVAPLHPDDSWFAVMDHVRALGEKDLGFAVHLADELHVDVPMTRLALERLAPGLGLPPIGGESR